MKLSDDEFDQLRVLLHQHCGLALTPDKQYLIRARLEPVARKNQLASFSDLIKRFKEVGQLVFRDEVIEAMTTNETSFNRDGHPYEELKRTILPRMIEQWNDRRRSNIPFSKMRIWSVAAATGQEPYSIAMNILDFLKSSFPRGAQTQNTQAKTIQTQPATPEDFWILGSDISERALKVAREAEYQSWEVERGVTAQQRRDYFIPSEDRWKLIPEVRKMVEFRKLNILSNISDLTGFDLIFCRNLLIYFDDSTRASVLQKLAVSLNPGGMLVLGAAEHLPPTLESGLVQKMLGRTMAFVKP